MVRLTHYPKDGQASCHDTSFSHFETRLTHSTRLQEWAEQDRRASAIPKDLWDANIQVLDGDSAIEYLLGDKLGTVGGYGQQYVTGEVKRLLNSYQHLREGIWCTREGVPYAKPFRPRNDIRKLGKKVKRETPPGATAAPIVPKVDAATAAAYGTTPDEFWQWVIDSKHPVAITEGLKKALSMIAHGIPAIAIRGITQWHVKGTDTLHPEIAAIAEGRRVYITFDQDEKPRTIAAVRQQVNRLGTVLESHGCSVSVPVWESTQGKGVDDCLSSLGDKARDWLDNIIKTAPTLKQYKRQGAISAALNTIDQLNTLSFPIERSTENEYLPQLPPISPGAIHVVDAPMGSGKSWRLGRDWVQSALRDGQRVLVLSPLNSLGQQTAKDWGISHIHDLRSADDWEALRVKPGVVLCPDSIGKLPGWFWEKPCLLVLDEANQVTEHICQGDTLKSKYVFVLERLQQVATDAIAIVLSEDGIPDRCVKFWQSLSGKADVRTFRHRKMGSPWKVSMYSNLTGYRAALLSAIGQESPLLFVTTSQREGKRLERIINERFTVSGEGSIKAVRIDSETNENGAFSLFFRDPDTWLEINKPDVLILSPSAKSGVSIQGGVSVEDAYFGSVWGYFPALATDAHMQLLGRYRPGVPRNVYIPPFILGSCDEGLYTPRAVKERMRGNLETLARLFDLEIPDGLQPIEEAILDYLSEARAVSGRQKVIAQQALIDRLEASGHTVTLTQVPSNSAITRLWEATQDGIWQDEALEIAKAEVVPEHHTPAWARETLESMESKRSDRIVAYKVLRREEFPGVAFDDQGECYEALCVDYGLMRRGVLLHAQALHLDAVKASDRAATEAILGENVRAAHRLPRNYVKAAIINKLNVLSLLTGPAWHNNDKRAIAIKDTALKYATEISYWLRLQIKSDQTPVEVVNKLMRKIGLVATVVKQVGGRGKQIRHWHVPGQDHPLRMRLLNAAQEKLSGSVSTICNKEKPYIQIVLTTPDTPPPRKGNLTPGSIVRWAKIAGLALIEAVEGASATLSDEYGATFSAPLGELEEVYV